ncbi:MAG: SPASM domain-containing protein [Rhodospirillales bacterium]|nr:SPASM domain-containing protein [Rhodospirillales bacterium]
MDNNDTGFDANKDFQDEIINEDWKKHRSQEYFDYRELWESVPENKIETDFPLNVDIETTDVCNLKCPMCSRTIKAEAGLLDELMITREEYSSLIDQCVEHGAKAIKLNYDGEPLSHKDVVWHVKHAKDRGIVDVLINTNATLLKGKKAEPLLAAGLDTLIISFDAVSPDLYEDARVGTTIGIVIDNIYSIVKLRNEKYPGCQIKLQMVMYDDPIWRDQFDAMKIMWGKLVDSLGYSPVVSWKEKSEDPFPEVEGWWCSQPLQRMVLKINGKVSVCCPDIWDEIVVGDWRKEKLIDIWNSDKFSEFRRSHIEGDYYSNDTCRRCCYPHLEK